MAKEKKEQIELGEKKPVQKEILKVGEWFHDKAPGGKLKFTKEYLQQLADNFKINPFVPVTRGHQPLAKIQENPSLIIAKNITGMEVQGDSLVAVMDIDVDELDNYADVSVGIEPNYEDHKTGNIVGDVINHIAMVASPYIKNLSSFTPLGEEQANEPYFILLSDIEMPEDKKTEVETIEEVKTELEADKAEEKVETEEEKPTEEEPKTEGTPKEEPEEEKPEGEPKVELSEGDKLKVELEELQKQNAEMRRTLDLQEAESSFRTLLNAGKVTPALKEDFIALSAHGTHTIELSDGKSETVKDLIVQMLEKLPQIIPLSEKGVTTDKEPTDVSAAYVASMKQSFMSTHKDATEEDFTKYLQENMDLVKKYGSKK